MTYTELFRDFLCMHGIKKLFEECYKINNASDAFNRKYKLSFKDDFMTKALSKEKNFYHEYDFLSPIYFITWSEPETTTRYGDMIAFWEEKNSEWLEFVKKAHKLGLIDKT